MADNTTLNAGTGGDTIASDDIAGVKHQRIKLSVGADGAASDAVPVSNGLDTTAAGVQAVGLVAQFDDASVGTVTENQFAPVRISSRRALLVEGVASGTVIPVSDGGGNLSIDDGGNSITVDGAVTVTNATAANLKAEVVGTGTLAVQVDGAALTALQLLDDIVRSEDEASADTHKGAVVLAVRQDTPAASSGTDGDYEPLKVTGGRLAVQATGSGSFTVAQGTAANLNCTEASAATIATNTGSAATSLGVMDDWDNAASDGCSVSGDVAHDAVDAGEPIKLGGRADTTFQTAVADGDRVAALFDVYGALYTRGDHPNKWNYHDDDTAAVTTDGTVQAAPGAGLSVYITDIVFSIGAATASSIFLEESTTKILGPFYLEAVAGRSIHIRLATPKKCTANTAILVTNTGSISFAVDISGFIAP